MRQIFFLIPLLLLVLPQQKQAWAFPEMIRKGYSNCTTCHVANTGGGTLTQYGRELSRELLSWSGTEHEGDFAWGLVKTPEWLLPGGDLRLLQTYQDTPLIRQAQFILMQGDLEAAVVIGKFTADATAGFSQSQFLSRRHFLQYHLTDEFAVRAGRFYPAYGINTPDHIIVTRRGLGWDERQETYNLEGSWISENWNVFLTGIAGRPDDTAQDREKGGAAQVSYSFHESYKVGANYYYGTNDAGHRNLVGPWGILGFTPNFFLLSEFDFQFASPTGLGVTQKGFVDYQRLDYEIFQGFHLYVTQELSRLDFSNALTAFEAYTGGIQFFPRPHFEILAAWQKYRQSGGDFSDLAYIMFHFYP